MSEEATIGITPSITRIANETLSERINIPQATAWLETHPTEFESQIQAFDQVVSTFNTADVLEYNRNQQTLKQTLIHPLPTISEMFNQVGTHRLKAFIRTMRTVNEQMIRGETTEEEPYLRFHATVANDNEALVIGAIFHVYEELLISDPQYHGIQRGQLVEALVEALATNKENPLYDPISNRERLNWIDGWKGFTPEFRQLQGFV